MNQSDGKGGTAVIGPMVHVEFIQNQTLAPEEEAMAAVEEYHRALFLHQHAADLERFQQESKIHEERLAHLDLRLKEIQASLATREKIVAAEADGQPDIKPTAPWNGWDLTMFAAALVGIVTLLVFGILNISFNLLESGLVTFVENPLRAYFWAALLPVGALAVKVGWDLLRDLRAREIYLWTCLGLGVAGVLAWVGSYAFVYPTLSKTTAEQVRSLSVFEAPTSGFTAAGAKWTDVMIVGSQATAEIFLSAVLGIYMTLLYARHRPVRLAQNPLFAQLDEERRQLEETVASERIALAEARGNHGRLTHQLEALVAYAKSLFQKETALRRDQVHQKRILLDQISEQLKSQLQTMQNGDASHAIQPPRLALGGDNGK